MDTIGERLREERERLGFSQPAFGAIGGVAKRAQINYEQGARMPDASYLAAVTKVGVDTIYVLTGERRAAAVLTPEEHALLGHFRDASKDVRRAAIGALVGAAAPSADRQPQQFSGPVYGGVAGRDVVNNSKKGNRE